MNHPSQSTGGIASGGHDTGRLKMQRLAFPSPVRVVRNILASAILLFTGPAIISAIGDTGTLSSLTDDAQAISISGTLSVNAQTSTYCRVGQYGGAQNTVVYVFQLPSTLLTGTAQKFTDANFSIHMGSGGTVAANGDLYGLPYDIVSPVFADMYYEGASDPNATLLQKAFLKPGLASYATVSSTNSSLSDYLNTQMNAARAAGDATAYVFLRVNPDAAMTSNQNYLVAMREQGGTNTPTLGYTTVPADYTWGNVQIGGAGYITGLIQQPMSPYLIYARTDVGGAYRLNASTSKWVPITDSFSDPNQYNCNSIAIDPNNANRVYYAAGQWSGHPYDVYVSNDQGATWARTNLNKWMQGNGALRYAGERLMVDPNNSNIVYCATMKDGLWKRSGTTWAQVSLPFNGESGNGLSFVAIDKNGGTTTVGGQTVSKYIYTGAYTSGTAAQGGIMQSADGGATWTVMTGGVVTKPIRGTVAGDGTFFATATGDVVKAARGSTVLTSVPTVSGTAIVPYCGLAIDPSNAQTVMVAENKGASGGTCRIWRSTNGGAAWSQITTANHAGNFPWASWFVMPSSILISATNSNEVTIGDGFGVLRTTNIGTTPSDWYATYDGTEELVILSMACTTSGSNFLFTGVADAMAFQHTSLTGYPTRANNPKDGYVTGIDFCEADPLVVARCHGNWNNAANVSYTTNGGATWVQSTGSPSNAGGKLGGRLVVSATNSSRFVWVPDGAGLTYYTTDRGAHWTQSTGNSPWISGEFLQFWQPLAADRVDGMKFYSCRDVSTSGSTGYLEINRSTNGGASFQPVGRIDYPVGKTSSGYNAKIAAAPGVNGEVWVSTAGAGGLYRSTDSGVSFTKVSTVSGFGLFAFGKAATGHTNPAVFFKGSVVISGTSTSGIFRSDDSAATWTKINIPSQPVGNYPSVMEGDRRVFGRVYIGTSGRGLYYGTP